MNTTGKIITGFLTGTLLGLVAGLLVAPATGKKTRKDIQKKSKKLAKQLGGYVGINSRPVSKASKNGKASVPASWKAKLFRPIVASAQRQQLAETMSRHVASWRLFFRVGMKNV